MQRVKVTLHQTAEAYIRVETGQPGRCATGCVAMATQLVCARALPVAHSIACAQLALDLPGLRSIDTGPGARRCARRTS